MIELKTGNDKSVEESHACLSNLGNPGLELVQFRRETSAIYVSGPLRVRDEWLPNKLHGGRSDD